MGERSVQRINALEQNRLEKPRLQIVEQGHRDTARGVELLVSGSCESVLMGEVRYALRLSSHLKSFCGKNLSYWVLMVISSLSLLVGGSSAALLGRFYFLHGGSHRWIYTWNQSVGWPIILILLILIYWHQSVRPMQFSLKLLIIYLLMGCLTTFDNLLYSWGLSFLSVSTNSLLSSSQLGFSALFTFLLVRKKINPYSLNSVVLITISAALLAVHSSSDRPVGISEKQYIFGFVASIAAASIFALSLTLTEIIYRRVVGKSSFMVVLEIQTFISAAATVFSMVGMWIEGDFSAMSKEANQFDLGPSVYTLTLIWSAIAYQLFFVGSAGIIFLTSSLMACVFTTATIPLVPVLAVIFFHDSFSALKAISMLLSMWGFASYIYGGYMESRKCTPEGETAV